MTQPHRQLFGTDGIRGVAGEFPLTKQSTYLIGRALGHDLIQSNSKAQAVIGQDTRESSRWIADRVSEGLAAVGVEVHSAGVITTPGVAYLARSRGFAAGVVISASHNPWTDNGIKVFSGDGFKLTDARELAIEKEIFALLENPAAADETALKLPKPSLPGEAELRQAYIHSLAASVSSDLSKLRVLVDCGNGAATAGSRTVPCASHSGQVPPHFARWQKHQQKLRRITSGNSGQDRRRQRWQVRSRRNFRRRR